MYQLKYPVAFHSVDMAITRIKDGRTQILLAQKLKDTEIGKWRFPGGFLDPWDPCAEEAALREAMEETGMCFYKEDEENPIIDKYFEEKAKLSKKIISLIEDLAEHEEISKLVKQIRQINPPAALSDFLSPLRKNIQYIGSTVIDDARYRETDHRIITSFYELSPIEGFDKDGEGPFDDIARTKWFDMVEIAKDMKDEEPAGYIHPAHVGLMRMFLERHNSDFYVKLDNITKRAEKIGGDVSSLFKELKSLF